MVVSMISIFPVDGALDNPTFLLSSSQQKLSISKGSSSSVATGKTLLAPAILFFSFALAQLENEEAQGF